MAIYVRHGDDHHQPGVTSKHDTPLTERGKSEARRTALALQRAYGLPTVIVCSPYMRARQTAEKMVKALGVCVSVVVDPELSKYVTRRNLRDLDVRNDTLRHAPPIQETREEFQARVMTHYTDHVLNSDRDPTKMVWYITHGIFVREIAVRCCHLPAPHQIDSCHWVNVTTKQTSWQKEQHHHRGGAITATATRSPAAAAADVVPHFPTTATTTTTKMSAAATPNNSNSSHFIVEHALQSAGPVVRMDASDLSDAATVAALLANRRPPAVTTDKGTRAKPSSHHASSSTKKQKTNKKQKGDNSRNGSKSKHHGKEDRSSAPSHHHHHNNNRPHASSAPSKSSTPLLTDRTHTAWKHHTSDHASSVTPVVPRFSLEQ